MLATSYLHLCELDHYSSIPLNRLTSLLKTSSDVSQAELFDKFLHGSTLEECYSVVASVANHWLDLLDNQGKDIADSELLDYISESSTMSKSLADYDEQKSCDGN
ncbi:DNA polymerase epsilon catalytic subunit A-like protein [Tanacetum coccineum]